MTASPYDVDAWLCEPLVAFVAQGFGAGLETVAKVKQGGITLSHFRSCLRCPPPERLCLAWLEPLSPGDSWGTHSATKRTRSRCQTHSAWRQSFRRSRQLRQRYRPVAGKRGAESPSHLGFLVRPDIAREVRSSPDVKPDRDSATTAWACLQSPARISFLATAARDGGSE
jgi:hypothetical protein